MNQSKTRPFARIFCFFIFLVFVPLVPVFADFFDDLEIVPGIRFWGADLELRYKGIVLAPSLVTRLCVLGGAGYEDPGYYRNLDGSFYKPPFDSADDLALYKRLNLTWGLGIRQGVLLDDRKNDNLLEAHLLLRGRYDDHIEADSNPGALVFGSGMPDADGIFQNSIVAGMFFNTILVHKEQRKRTGMSADFSIEYAPEFLGNNVFGLADFTRFTFDLRSFLTVLDLSPIDEPHTNTFNIYMCNRIVFDTLVGPAIPINARQSIGGRSLTPSNAVGYSVRGIDDRRFDSFMKVILNTDIRMDFPTMPFFDIVPGGVFYFDVGIFDNLDYSLTLSNLKYSTGLGVFFYIYGFDLIFYGNYFINENRFSFSFDFSLQF